MEFIDPVIDQRHLSNLQDGQLPLSLCLRTHDELWLLDHRWVPRFVYFVPCTFLPCVFKFGNQYSFFDHRLRAAGLLPFARLVERHRHRSACFLVDRALLSVWVDRWRLEMHMFHLAVGEVTITL